MSKTRAQKRLKASFWIFYFLQWSILEMFNFFLIAPFLVLGFKNSIKQNQKIIFIKLFNDRCINYEDYNTILSQLDYYKMLPR